MGDPGCALHHLYIAGAVTNHTPTDNDLVPAFQRSIAESFFRLPNSNTLRDIMLKAVFDSRRATRIHLSVVEVGFFLIQIGLLYLLVVCVPYIADIQTFWLCSGQAQIVLASWMGVMAVFAGFIRTFIASPQTTKAEIIHLRPLPPSYVYERCEKCTSTNDPSIPPAIGHTTTPNPTSWNTFANILQCIHDDWALFTLLARRMLAVQHISHGMVLVLRQSGDVAGQVSSTKRHLIRVFCGFFHALVLILLTVVLGSTYNSDILRAAMFLVAFLALIVISRTYSVYICCWMEHAFDHIVIEYDTATQLNAIRTIIAGMPSVSVHNLTTGKHYRAGNLVDPDCATRHAQITKSRRRRVQIVTTGLVGAVSGVMMVVMYLIFRSLFGNALRYSDRMAFSYIAMLFVVFWLMGKVCSDFGFIDAHWDSMESGPEVTSPV